MQGMWDNKGNKSMELDNLAKDTGEPITYRLRCPNGHIVITWVRDTKICNQCRLARKKEKYGKRACKERKMKV